MKVRKHVTLVYVCHFKTWNLYPPLGVAFLAASLRTSGYQVTIVDTTFQPVESIYQALEQNGSALVGFEILQSNFLQSLVIAQKIRGLFPALPIVFGGPFPSAVPAEILKQAVVDFVLRGEGEKAIIEIMEHLDGERALAAIDGLCYKEDGSSIINPPRTPVHDLDSIAPAAYDLLPMASYLKIPMDMPMASPGTTLAVTRGCYGNCLYCQPISRNLFGRGVRRCSPPRVIEEIRRLCQEYKIRSLYFADDEPLWRGEEWWQAVADLLGQSGLKIDLMLNARVDAVNESMLTSLKRVGLKYLAFGVETGSDQILKNLRKGYTADKIIPTFQLCRKLGIVSRANIMIGSPGESWATIDETLKMLSAARPDIISISCTTAVPGTDLYESRQARYSSNDLFSDLFDRKHIISIADGFSEADIRLATQKVFDLFKKMSFHDLFFHAVRKRELIKMLVARELSLWRIDPWLPFRDIGFHLGYTKRTFV